MSDSTEETIKQDNTEVLEAIAALSKQVNDRIDGLEKSVNSQFETIREGLVQNNIAFDRLQSVVYSLRANFNEFYEETRQSQKNLSLK